LNGRTVLNKGKILKWRITGSTEKQASLPSCFLKIIILKLHFLARCDFLTSEQFQKYKSSAHERHR
jgi:hypothetical protein